MGAGKLLDHPHPLELHRSSRTAPGTEKNGIAGFLQTMPIFFQGIKSLSETPFRGAFFIV